MCVSQTRHGAMPTAPTLTKRRRGPRKLLPHGIPYIIPCDSGHGSAFLGAHVGRHGARIASVAKAESINALIQDAMIRAGRVPLGDGAGPRASRSQGSSCGTLVGHYLYSLPHVSGPLTRPATSTVLDPTAALYVPARKSRGSERISESMSTVSSSLQPPIASMS